MADHSKFIAWLKAKHKVTSDDELKSVLDQLGEEGIKKEHAEFEQGTQSMKNGSKFDYFKCLQSFKKGGKVDCGCSPKKVKSAQLGSILGAATNLLGTGTKIAGTVNKVSKIANTVGKVAKIGQGISSMFNKNTQQIRPNGITTQVGMVNPNQIPGAVTSTNPVNPTFAAKTIPKIQGYSN